MTNTIETAVTTGKYASIISHIKNNRIEYLVLIVLAHGVGLTDKILQQTSGVCL